MDKNNVPKRRGLRVTAVIILSVLIIVLGSMLVMVAKNGNGLFLTVFFLIPVIVCILFLGRNIRALIAIRKKLSEEQKAELRRHPVWPAVLLNLVMLLIFLYICDKYTPNDLRAYKPFGEGFLKTGLRGTPRYLLAVNLLVPIPLALAGAWFTPVDERSIHSVLLGMAVYYLPCFAFTYIFLYNTGRMLAFLPLLGCLITLTWIIIVLIKRKYIREDN